MSLIEIRFANDNMHDVSSEIIGHDPNDPGKVRNDVFNEVLGSVIAGTVDHYRVVIHLHEADHNHAAPRFEVHCFNEAGFEVKAFERSIAETWDYIEMPVPDANPHRAAGERIRTLSAFTPKWRWQPTPEEALRIAQNMTTAENVAAGLLHESNGNERRHSQCTVLVATLKALHQDIVDLKTTVAPPEPETGPSPWPWKPASEQESVSNAFLRIRNLLRDIDLNCRRLNEPLRHRITTSLLGIHEILDDLARNSTGAIAASEAARAITPERTDLSAVHEAINTVAQDLLNLSAELNRKFGLQEPAPRRR